MFSLLWQDKERASRFQQALLEEQKSLQAQERASFQKAQKAEAKSHLSQFKTELRKQGLSGPEQRQRLTQVWIHKLKHYVVKLTYTLNKAVFKTGSIGVFVLKLGAFSPLVRFV